jgi:hypothetical protein
VRPIPQLGVPARYTPTSGWVRYCCKSPKLPGANFPAVKKSDRRPPIDVASITLPGSPASFSSDNEVPHIFTWKSPVQPKEILIASAKRLLQQNLPQAAVSNRSKQQCYSITSSAVASSVVGMERPSALAAFRLITNSNLVGRSIGRSAALVPPKILETYAAARRNMCRRSGP